MAEHNIESIMNVTLDNLKAMVDADTIIGTPISVGEVTLIPVSKVSFGLATGGSDIPSKNTSNLFGGGGGAGGQPLRCRPERREDYDRRGTRWLRPRHHPGKLQGAGCVRSRPESGFGNEAERGTGESGRYGNSQPQR